MVHVTRSGECGNSPKNSAAQEFVVALLTMDAGSVAASLHPDAELRIGQRAIGGLTEIADRVSKGLIAKSSHIRIVHSISHGRVAAVNGEVETSGVPVSFCVFLEFADAKLRLARAIRVYTSRPDGPTGSRAA